MPQERSSDGALHPMQATVGQREEKRQAFGKWLTDTLRAKRITTKALSETLSTPKRKVDGWANGEAIPYMATLEQLALALHSPLSEVLEAAGKQTTVQLRFASEPAAALPAILRKWRESAGLNTTEAGDRSGVGQSSWSRYESGSAVPGRKNLVALSDYTGIPAATLAASVREKSAVPEALDAAVGEAVKPFPTLVRLAAGVQNLTTEDLAERVGVSPVTFAGWLRGRNNPSLCHVQTLAKVLGVSVSSILQAVGVAHFASERIEQALNEIHGDEYVRTTATFGQLMAAGRKDRDLTMTALAGEVDCSRYEVIRYEKDQRIPRSLDRIDQISQVLSIPLSDLLVASGQLAESEDSDSE